MIFRRVSWSSILRLLDQLAALGIRLPRIA
jgi:hypothetical protein